MGTDVTAAAEVGEVDEEPRAATRNELIALAAIVVVASAIRIVQGTTQSLFGDEFWTYVGATHGDLSGVLDWVRSDEEITPPLVTILSWASVKLGDPTVLVRLPSMLAGIALIPVLFELGRRTLGPRVGLIAALLATLNPYLIWYSVEARAYSLALLLVALSTLSLLIALERRDVWAWVAYGAFSCAAMYTHYTAAFVLLAQFVWVPLVDRSALKPALIANAVAALAFLPWVPALLDDFDSPTQKSLEFLAPFTLDNVVSFTAAWAFGLPSSFGDFWGTAGALMLALGFAVALVALVQRHRRAGRLPVLESPRGRYVLLFVMLALAAPIGAAVTSIVGNSMFLPRNLVTSAAGLSLVMAIVLASGARPLRWVALVLVAGTLAVGTVMTFETRWQRPQFAEMAAFIDDNAGPDDVVVSLPGLRTGGPPPPSYPPAQALTAYSDEPHAWFLSIQPDDLPAILEAAEGHRLILAGDVYSVGLARTSLGLDGIEPSAQVDYDSVVPTTIEVYERPMPDGSGKAG